LKIEEHREAKGTTMRPVLTGTQNSDPCSNGAYTAELESTLIAKSLDGDRAAYGELVCHYHSGVVNVVYRMCADAWLAQDAAQTAFIKAWERLDKFKPGTSFRNWLYRIAVNSARDCLRREKETVDISGLNLATRRHSPEAHTEQSERIEIVRQAVAALPEASRAALILREYEGLSYQEIAETLDIPLGTVMSRLSYARKRLTETLQPYLESI
jgi:RNA polymerase sigma-70 factor (ECF subfamily)